MLDKLIPWKKRNTDSSSNLAARHGDELFASLRRDFDNLLTRFFDEGWPSRLDNGMFRSNVEFDEDETGYTMTVELPGFEPNDIDVKVSSRVLTIRAERRDESKIKNGRSYRYGSFYETFQLPPNAKADVIDANYHSGVLEVRVPKDERMPSKRIEVKAA
ncbi:MAG: Hsp20/alpha crystallin family protein [Planctomycetales bacterium]|nr:Hsp20/alpha crystallin family protein [Planctomycetales bacterium]